MSILKIKQECRYCGAADQEPPFCKSCGATVEQPEWTKDGEPYFYKGYNVAVYRNPHLMAFRIVINDCEGEVRSLMLTDEVIRRSDVGVDIIGKMIDGLVDLEPIKVGHYVARFEKIEHEWDF